MKLTCSRDEILKEISIAQEVISSKNSLSILSNVLLTASKGTLKLQATDLKVDFATIPYASKTPEVQNARHFRRYARELGRHFLGRYPSHFVRGSYVLPRLLRCLLDRDYSGAIAWLAPLTVYLLQLESVINQPGAIFTTRRVG